MSRTTAIAGFWAWFGDHQRQLRNIANDPALVTQLEQKLDELGESSWEIGPHSDAGHEFFFAISFGGDLGRIATIERVIDAAPHLDGWRFVVGKPRKSWDRVFRWGEDRLPIDANDWQFVVYRYSDGLHDVVLVNPELANFSETERINLVGFVVASELGERLMAETVNAVDADPTIEKPPAIWSIRELHSILAGVSAATKGNAASGRVP